MRVLHDDSSKAVTRPIKVAPKGSLSPYRTPLGPESGSPSRHKFKEPELLFPHSPLLPSIGGKAEAAISGGGCVNSLTPGRSGKEEDIFQY